MCDQLIHTSKKCCITLVSWTLTLNVYIAPRTQFLRWSIDVTQPAQSCCKQQSMCSANVRERLRQRSTTVITPGRKYIACVDWNSTMPRRPIQKFNVSTLLLCVWRESSREVSRHLGVNQSDVVRMWSWRFGYTMLVLPIWVQEKYNLSSYMDSSQSKLNFQK